MTEYDRFGDRDAASGSDQGVGTGTGAIRTTIATDRTSPVRAGSASYERTKRIAATPGGLVKDDLSDIAA